MLTRVQDEEIQGPTLKKLPLRSDLVFSPAFSSEPVDKVTMRPHVIVFKRCTLSHRKTMRQYLKYLRHIKKFGMQKSDRTGTGTLSVLGYQMRFDLDKGFPL